MDALLVTKIAAASFLVIGFLLLGLGIVTLLGFGWIIFVIINVAK